MARTSTTKTLNTTPPKTVANAAARGLRLREQHRRGGTAIGVARARDLSAQKQLSAQTIRRMHAYFARHSVDKTGKGWADRTKPSAGYIAWLLWGGDAGQRWAERLHARLQAGDNKQTGAATQKAASTKSSAKKCGENRCKRRHVEQRSTYSRKEARDSPQGHGKESHEQARDTAEQRVEGRHQEGGCQKSNKQQDGCQETRQQEDCTLEKVQPGQDIQATVGCAENPSQGPRQGCRPSVPQPGRQHGGCEAVESQESRGVGAANTT